MTRYFENEQINRAFIILRAMEEDEREHPERVGTAAWAWMRERARKDFVDAVLGANA